MSEAAMFLPLAILLGLGGLAVLAGRHTIKQHRDSKRHQH